MYRFRRWEHQVDLISRRCRGSLPARPNFNFGGMLPISGRMPRTDFEDMSTISGCTPKFFISGRCHRSLAFRQELISKTCQRSLAARQKIEEMSPIWMPKKHSLPQGLDPAENDGNHHPSNFHASDFLASFSERRCRKNSVNQRVK